MTQHATQSEPMKTRGPRATVRFAGAAGWLLAVAYLAAGLWLTWGGSEAVDAAKPSTLALVVLWLLYGLAWPVRVVRPWLWVGLWALQVALLAWLGRPWVGLSLSVLHLLAFDTRWLPRRVPAEPEALFYDGYCGLCHRWVKRVLRADDDGVLFYFAQLQGTTIERVLTPSQRASLPDSIVVRTVDGRVLVKSDAGLHILDALGGWYRLFGIVMRAVPRPVRDLAYDGVAKVRHTLFAKPTDACPMVDAGLRTRFRV